LARDLFHLHSACRRASWSSITGKLGSIMNVLELEVKHRRHTVSIFSNFLEACLTPTVKIEKRTAFGASSSFLLKSGILLGTPEMTEKHLRGIRLEIECITAAPKTPQQRQSVLLGDSGTLTPPACATGRFMVRTFLYGVPQEPQAAAAAELRLTELLLMQALGQKVYTLPAGLELALEPLIDLLLKKFYTDTR
uniref:BRCA1/BRCA2-containing complex subunit 45 n=1 Tax=Schistocephalus solidus TaxID=70667 RepID=A0A183TJN8_SCHSO